MGLCSRYTILTSSNTACRADDFLQILCKTKSRLLSQPTILAGAEGLEPSTKVLETHVLPLHHTPKHFFSIARKAGIVNRFFTRFDVKAV